ncbi:DHA1 family tetracycline resistance protein-like MFS transporter [Deinobacterium chartae]|uniref:DHA1 family tetracycline resistance protein-like MFS transporter n=1 Tax=Deinobacterium chartae TaxID=521158 RepID=A0A841HYD3_9DEIO|nr:MFS transporter [Deinobacterium chartae]MBB6097893.1 DHA1 family tetracycline resistance protein-like MFS transporter [Deinobacterium chartae]
MSRPPNARHARTPSAAFIFVTLVIDMLGIGLIIPVLPELVTQLSPATSDAPRIFGLLISLHALMQLLCSPLLGALSDACGRRPVLLFSTLGTALAYLMMFFSPSLAWLLAARVLGGISSANVTAANAYIADVSTPANRARNFGMVGAAMGLGLIAGPSLGGLLGEMSLRLPLLFAAALAALNLLYGLFVLPESHPPSRRTSLTGARLNPLRTLLLLRQFPALGGWALAVTLTHLALQFSNSTWVLHGSLRFGWSSGANGLSLAASGLLTVLVSLLLPGPVVARLGERRTITAALLLGALGYLLYGLADSGWMLYASMPLSVMLSLGGPALQSLLARSVPPESQGAVQGTLASLNSLSAIVGPLVATALFTRYAAQAADPLPGIVFFACSLLLLLSCAAAQRASRNAASRL